MCPKREDDMVLIEIKKTNKQTNNLNVPNAREFRDIKRSNVSF